MGSRTAGKHLIYIVRRNGEGQTCFLSCLFFGGSGFLWQELRDIQFTCKLNCWLGKTCWYLVPFCTCLDRSHNGYMGYLLQELRDIQFTRKLNWSIKQLLIPSTLPYFLDRSHNITCIVMSNDWVTRLWSHTVMLLKISEQILWYQKLWDKWKQINDADRKNLQNYTSLSA